MGRPATPIPWTEWTLHWWWALPPVIAGESDRHGRRSDSHIHFISPQQVYEALSNGITTMIGGGTGPATGTNATTCSPGSWNIARMLEAADAVADELRIFERQRVHRRAR